MCLKLYNKLNSWRNELGISRDKGRLKGCGNGRKAKYLLIIYIFFMWNYEWLLLHCVFQLKKDYERSLYPCFVPWISNQNLFYSQCNSRDWGKLFIFFFSSFFPLEHFPHHPPPQRLWHDLSPDKKIHSSVSSVLPLK